MKNIFISAFELLDTYLKEPVGLLVGGGAAMLLAYKIPLSTMDVDGLLFETKISAAELDRLVKKVAAELKISPQWFNSYFSTFTYTVPKDFKERLKQIYKGKYLKAYAFGLEDLLVMKCFSGREKDVGHAKAIIKKGVDLDLVEQHLDALCEKGLPSAQKALDFFDEIKDQLGV